MKSQRFGLTRRVRRRSEFQQVFDAGSRVHGRFFTLIMAPNRAGTMRLGIVASRKLGDSVRRNRAKRLIREIFRQNVPAGRLPAADLVVIPKRELFDAAFSTLEADFLSALRRCAARLTPHAH
jgi:ribonuclease P protein component